MDGGNGGFQPDSRLPEPNSVMQAPEISTGLPSEMNISFGDEDECSGREPNSLMPMATLIRIMRNTLPENAKILDDCKDTIEECVSKFISLVTSKANLHCQEDQRNTVTPEDLLWAMSKLGFRDYIEPLAMYLNHCRESDIGVLKSSNSEPSTEIAADPVADPGPTNEFLNNPSGAGPGPSQKAEDNLDPFGHAKE